jgi:hypothetical protein
MPPAQMRDFTEKILAYRAQQISHQAFYAELRDQAQAAGVNISSNGPLARYIDYVSLYEKIEPEKIFAAIKAIETAETEKRIQTEGERALVRRGRMLQLAGKLVEFGMTREEWAEYVSLRGAPQGRRGNLINLPSFESFYQEAETRDKLMAENFIHEIATASQKPLGLAMTNIAILVTGGFHSTGIDRALTDAGFNVISFVPRLTKVDENGSAYLSAFAQEKTPLQKLFQGQKLFLTPEPLPDAIEAAGLSAALDPETPQLTFRELAGAPATLNILHNGAETAYLQITRPATGTSVLFVKKQGLKILSTAQMLLMTPKTLIQEMWGWLIPLLKNRGWSDSKILRWGGLEAVIFTGIVLVADAAIKNIFYTDPLPRLVIAGGVGFYLYLTAHWSRVLRLQNGVLNTTRPRARDYRFP